MASHLPPNKKFNTITDVPCQKLAFVKKQKQLTFTADFTSRSLACD